MTAVQRSGLAFGVLWVVVGIGVFGFQADPRDSARQAGRASSIRATRPEIARRGQYPREEWFVRDVYARLMRYDRAARQVARVETGVVPEPDAYLVVSLRNLRTQDVGASMQVASPDATAGGPRVTLQRRAFCYGDDPCHAYYDAAWGDIAGTAATAGEARTFGGPVMRLTTYDVTVTLGGQSRTYSAQVRYHEAGDAVSVESEVLDPAIPDLQQVADDEAPLAVAAWTSYVKTRRYAAVVKRITDLRRAGKRTVPDGAPIGSLPGDDVTAHQEAMVMMTAGEPCSAANLQVWADRQTLRPEGAGTPDVTTIHVMTSPPTPGVVVTLTLEAEANSGGHMDLYHVGARPAGSLSATSGTTGPDGGFDVGYVAPVVGERVTVRAWLNDKQATFRMDIGVPGLEELLELGPGSFQLIGFANTPAHPQGTNHWGTPYANGKLRDIAQAYLDAFPEAEVLQYNDQSLPWGGRFDYELRNWASGAHAEHRLGTNCDVDSASVPLRRRSQLMDIFRANGSTDTLNEVACCQHWHLRF